MISHHSFEYLYPQMKRQNKRSGIPNPRNTDYVEVIHLKRSPSLNMGAYSKDTGHETASPFALETPQKPSMRGRLCPYVSNNGTCKFMSECVYSHTIEEARRHNLHFKTKICEFAAKGFCKKANTCRFAHSFSELGSTGCEIKSLGMDRVSGSVSTDVTTPTEGGMNVTRELLEEDLSPISEQSRLSSLSSPRVCYVAPAKQRAVLRHRPQRQVFVPSAFHYVEQMEKRKSSSQPLLPTPSLVQGASHMLYPYYNQASCPTLVYGAPMVGYSMVMENVVYED